MDTRQREQRSREPRANARREQRGVCGRSLLRGEDVPRERAEREDEAPARAGGPVVAPRAAAPQTAVQRQHGTHERGARVCKDALPRAPRADAAAAAAAAAAPPAVKACIGRAAG